MKKFFGKLEQKGSTLVELLLYMGIFSILTIALFQLFSTIIGTQLESQSTSSVLTDGQYIVNRLNYDVKRAKTINSPAIGTQSASLQLVIDGALNTFSLSSGNITIASAGAGTAQQLNSVGTSISSLNFSRLSDNKGEGTDTVTVSFTINSTTLRQGSPQTESFKTTIGIRPKQ